MNRNLFKATGSIFVLAALLGRNTFSDDWPMWHHDAAHSAVTPEKLPAALHLQWVRELPSPRPAWPETQWELHFDVSYEPVIMGSTLFVPSMACDSVTAYDTDTGAETWRFYADGPVRFAPVAHNGKLWFGSDDGRLYCLNAEDGTLLWKIRGGPDARTMIGNDRLVGMWPIRGAPVLYDGKIYFASGIWPFMGVFIRAVDAETGKSVWNNSGTGSMYTGHPHGSTAFGGIAPQGYVAAENKRILVPGGRTLPAVFDRSNGRLLYYDVGNQAPAGYDVSIDGRLYEVHGNIRYLENGRRFAATSSYYLGGVIYELDAERRYIRAHRIRQFPPGPDGKQSRKPEWEDLWIQTYSKVPDKIHIQAGGRLYCSRRDGGILAVELDQKPGSVSWRGTVEGSAWTMLVADGRLFVVTEEGSIYCFGARQAKPTRYPLEDREIVPAADAWSSKAKGILRDCGDGNGYCISLGVGSGRLVQEIVRQSRYRVIAIDPDARKVAAFRRAMDAAGLYGSRVTARVGDAFDFPLPPFLASLIVSEDPGAAGFAPGTKDAMSIFRPLRPYGGVAYLDAQGAESTDLLKWARAAKLEEAKMGRFGDFVAIRRPGSLPGSADWTHQNADPANSLVSKDTRVRAPLGLLWFGGPSNDEVLPRHGHGPSPQVVAGRLFIEGPNMLRAVDVYTGRVLWEREIGDLGRYHDTVKHWPGAGETGGNYVSLADSVYVVTPETCLRLDSATGRTVREFNLPAQNGKSPRWGWVAVWENLLVAAVSPLRVDYPAYPAYTIKEREQIELAEQPLKKPEGVRARPLESIETVRTNEDYSSAGRRLIVMDRHSGEVLWSRDAHYAFRHNAIAVAKGKVLCMDKMSRRKMAHLVRRGLGFSRKSVLYALDACTGKEIWKVTDNVFGTWLAYSEEHDVLLEAGGGGSKDRPTDDLRKGMAVYKGSDGTVVWRNNDISYSGPCMLHHNWIIHNGGAIGLLTGEIRKRTHALTGKRQMTWKAQRGYGCGTMVASEYLLTFRSSAAGFYDLVSDTGTGNLGGFKSGCTANLIAANGVLNAPDYTRTCTCSYQLQSSLAMVHDPGAEMWIMTPYGWDGEPVTRVGINLGAPGDRLAASGTLWLDFPSIGGKSPDIPVTVEGGEPEYFRHHSTLFLGENLRWVAASGVTGADRIVLRITQRGEQQRPCTVRLVFAEPDPPAGPGSRVFDVLLQGAAVLSDFDIVNAAGGARRTVVKTFPKIDVSEELVVTMKAKAGRTLLCGVEIIDERLKGDQQ